MSQQNLETARRNAAAKLHPSALTTSTFIRSILGYLVDEVWTDPLVTGLAFDPDGDLYVQENGNPFYGRVLCTRSVLISAVLQLSQAAGLSPRERTYLLQKLPPLGYRLEHPVTDADM